MKRCFLILGLWLYGTAMSFGQDDLLAELSKVQKDIPIYTTATFKSTRLVSGHSIETIAAKHLDFRISHRFGAINSGFNELFGLDQSTIRLGLEYGVTDRLTVGLGRSSYEKVYDYYAKYKLLRQFSGSQNTPVTVTGLIAAYTTTQATMPTRQYFNNLERQSYCAQLLVARKFGEKLSLQVSPTVLHRNKSETPTDANTLYSVGMGGRFKLSRRTSLNAEYYYTLPAFSKANLGRDAQFTNALSIGFDIETGGHVFQLHLSNSKGMTERALIGQTTGQWSMGDIFYGFNISRVFSFDKQKNQHQ